MYSYSQLSLTAFMLATLSMRAMEQKDLPVTKNFEQLTINAINKPEPLLTLCIKHFGRARVMCNADGNTLGHLLSPESIIPENLALDIIKNFPTNVIKESAQEIAQRLSTGLPAKMNIAFIDKLAECDAIVTCHTILQQLMNDPKTSKDIKKCINHHDPIFQSMKAFLIAQIYAQKLPEYQGIEQQQVRNTALSPDGKYHEKISRDDYDNNTVQILTVNGKYIATLSGHTDSISSLAWSPNGNYIATGSSDKTAKIWTIDGKCIATLTGHADSIWATTWSPDGKYLATGSSDKTVKIWTIKDNQWQCIITILTDHTGSIFSVSWSPDGKYVATGSLDNTAKIWTFNGQCLVTLTGHSARQSECINKLSWSLDGSSLTCGCSWSILYDKTTRKWDMHLLNTITQHPFSYNEIFLIKAIADAQKSNTMYPLNQQEQQIFNQLGSADPELREALHGALDPLVIKNELCKKTT